MKTITYQTQDGRTIRVVVGEKGLRGYAAHPGTGPEGETCGSCKNFVVREFAKRYFKCSLVNYTGGPGTDTRKGSPACSRWLTLGVP